MTLDTNILIAYLANEAPVVHQLTDWKTSGRPLIISSVTRAELISWSKLSNAKVETAREFLLQFISVSFDDRVADLAGRLRRRYPKLELPDAAIAATALLSDGLLVTRDQDFRRVTGLRLVII
ncbi:type II toxin-antitoxin system VapC family toxin [Candidatus Berkelbacteria bacterium]|nr:type II toxin-antitoxin system VapC family toxin [Candidatus Berkelbacteria bacterium]